MPRIPIYLAQERVSAATAAPAPSRGVVETGIGISRLGVTMQVRQEEERRLLEQQQRRQADLWLTRSVAELRSQTTQDYLTSQETAPADGAGFTQDRVKGFETRFQSFLEAAPTPEAAEEFQIHALGVRDDLMANAMGYEARMHGEAVKASYTDSLGQYAAVVRADPGQLGGSLADATATIERLALPADQRAGLIRETRETLGLSYFNGMIDANPGAAREELLEGGTAALTLAPDTRERMLGAADVEIRRREAEAKAAAAEARQIAAFHSRNRIEDEIAAAEDGRSTGLVTDNDLRLAYGDEGWEQAKASIEATRNVAVASTELALTPPSQWPAAIDSAAPAPAGEGYKQEVGLRGAMTGAAQDLAKELEADPAAYVFRHSPELQAVFEGASNDPAKLQSAIALSLSLQERMEVPPSEQRALTVPQATGLATDIATAEPGALLAKLDGYARSYGDAWTRVSGELVTAGLPAPLPALVALDNDPILRGAVVDALAAGGESALKSTLDKDALDSIDATLATELEDWISTMPQGAETTYVDALRLAAISLARHMDPSAAAKRAALAIMSRYEFAGDYRIPATFDAAAVERGLDRTIADLAGIDMEGGDPNLAPADRHAAGLAAIRADHHWMTNSDESGVVLLDENWEPVTRSGQPIGLSFAESEDLGKDRPQPVRGIGVVNP